ncbi:MAG: hypothetical protein M3R17_00115 [Bacteroidota bacterium]|nr:hypothetical protein [Bacteroidota bacterium]
MKRIIPGKHIRCFLLSVVILLLGGFTLHANPEVKRKIKYDTSSVVKREIAPDKQKEYNEDEAWKYDRDKTETKSEPTVFDRMWDGFWENVMESFQGDNHARGFNPWTILWVLIFVALVVLVILKLTNTGVSTLFSGRARKAETADATLEDVDIHAIDYEKQISDALAKSDYRLGVRLWFLRTLKTFSDNELVHWKIDKTNSDYYYELSGTAYQKEFGEVSNVYDYIWYGEFPVDENSYTRAEDKFRTLYQKVEKK